MIIGVAVGFDGDANVVFGADGDERESAACGGFVGGAELRMNAATQIFIEKTARFLWKIQEIEATAVGF